MYKLLIVDDEMYAVQAVQTGIEWSELGIADVLCAYDADEAKTVLQQQSIDVMICDIEMPDCNGVELLEWVNEFSPATLTIFLTGHADFAYAQQIVHLGGFDYLLKPIKYDQLQGVVARALIEVEQEREARRFEELYRTYTKLRDTQKPLLTELFWQDVLSKRIQPDPEHVVDLLNTYQVRLDPKSRVLPILISVEHWKREFTERDEDILEYALRNSASELIITPEIRGDVIEDRNGILIVLLYLNEQDNDSEKALSDSCERYIEACSLYFYCSLSCYIGEPVPITAVTNVYHRLIEMEQNNISSSGKVWLLKEQDDLASAPRKMPFFTFEPAEWMLLLEADRTEDIISHIEHLFRLETASGITAETLDALYHALLGFVYQAAHQKGFSVKQIIGASKGMDAGAATRSVPQFLSWAKKLLISTADFMQRNRSESSALIEKVKAYVDAHLKSVTREDIAAAVFLNSAYLSRLFKRETGVSLMEYIISAKMNRAKLMLTESNTRITDMIDDLGYDNLSHFTKMFKKQVGITPQEYRKRYQSIGM
jgi:two-component system response regulator YesN